MSLSRAAKQRSYTEWVSRRLAPNRLNKSKLLSGRMISRYRSLSKGLLSESRGLLKIFSRNYCHRAIDHILVRVSILYDYAWSNLHAICNPLHTYYKTAHKATEPRFMHTIERFCEFHINWNMTQTLGNFLDIIKTEKSGITHCKVISYQFVITACA